MNVQSIYGIHSSVRRTVRLVKLTTSVRILPGLQIARKFHRTVGNYGYGLPKLTPQQVTGILRANEGSFDYQSNSVRYTESNQLNANTPLEDRRAQAKCTLTNGMLFGVFDGHGGCSCAQAVKERLFGYIAVSLLPPDLLSRYDLACRNNETMDILEWFKYENDYVNQRMNSLYAKSLYKYASETLSIVDIDEEFTVGKALEDACVRLDADISTEALPTGVMGNLNIESLEVAFSGAVSVVAHIDGPHVHIANVGDCRAVLGSVNEDTGDWFATSLSEEHNCDNASERQRILANHPPNEASFVLKTDRLLGQLAPLRAFGDVRFKWRTNDLKHVIKYIDTPFAKDLIPPNYYTPPYLNAVPEISYHRLTPRDRFLILASDGLWDVLTPDKVVKLVGEHTLGKQTVDRFVLPRGEKIALNDLNKLLINRKMGLEMRPVDTNSATHLIRNALGGTSDGLEHRKLSAMLSYPSNIVRYFRDDITVTVIFFDTDYLRTCPA
ncbi:pyruvate dehydrogenase [acetyl-transferring]-phosphatase 1, mitochondrial-like [Tubulanus polymorphus]|uniref:pyruvate dehydrogenase [acetyl-transferring]-phosphatase 1, mitochondrial-like n=1 Tax=Tubulanus polymorphus TaxID=672921 RepID=UPI003DA4A6EB